MRRHLNTTGRPCHCCRWRWLLRVAALCLAVLTWRYWVPRLGEFLVRDDACGDDAEYMVLLMGEPSSRPYGAAQFLLTHPGLSILIAHPKDDELVRMGIWPNEQILTRQLLEKYGVAPNRIIDLGEKIVGNTREEVEVFKNYLMGRSPRPKSVVLMTSWYHSRRAAWTFARALEGTGVSVCSRPAFWRDLTPDRWYEQELGLIEVCNEYIKSLRYAVIYGLLGRDRGT